MAERLRSDTAIARRIVRSFIDFLGSVEVAPDADGEGIEVATECLTEVFGLSQQHDEDISKTLLVDLFTQKSVGSPGKEVLTPAFEEVTSASEAEVAPPGSSSSDAYGQFIEGLESAGYLNVPTGSSEYAARLSQAKSTFQETLKIFGKSKGKDPSELLAEAFKSQGNLAMAAQRYNEALELYTLAISICSNNAIYFANRAAAHTQAGNHAAAISDCHKAIEINPRYSKAYSRLGLVYYSQGRYVDAIQWFRKALELDPSNTALSRNIQSAQQELDQRSRQSHPDHQHTESRAPPGAEGPFTVDLRNLIPGIVNLSSQFGPASDEANGAEGQVYGNINVTYEAELPVDTMFEGRPQQGSNQAQAHEPESDNSNSNQPRDETGPRVGMPGFSEGLGPQIANLMQMFGGFHQGGAVPEVGQHNSPEFGQAQGNGSARVHVESTLPQEFTDQLQFALQSVLGMDAQRQQDSQGQQDQQP